MSRVTFLALLHPCAPSDFVYLFTSKGIGAQALLGSLETALEVARLKQSFQALVKNNLW